MIANSCRLAVSVAVLWCCACSPTQLVGSKYVKSEDVVASQGATLTVSAEESPELAGTTLVIPAGALAADTKITLELGFAPLTGSGDKTAGEAVIWGPAGTQFVKPATMTLRYTLQQGETADRLFVQVQEENGERFAIDRTQLIVDEQAQVIRFDVNGFTGFQPGTNAPCMSNNDCGMGQVCVNGVCKLSGCAGNPMNAQCQCQSNSECAQGQVCTNGACQACTGTTCAGSCSSINQCPMGQTCLNGQCSVCQNGACSTTCSANLPCSNGQVCLNGVCVAPACGPNAPCPMGQACSMNGQCVPVQNGCGAMGITCPSGQVCVNGNCTPTMSMCGPNVPCPTGQTCSANGVCVQCSGMNCPVCDASRPCAMGQVCVNGACQTCTNGACSACMTNAQCPQGLVCQNGQCRQTTTMCGPNAPCPMGQTCSALGQCVTSNACNAMQSCPMGQTCTNGVCTTPSTDGGTPVQCGGLLCPVGYSCVNQQCRAPANDGGTPDAGTDGGTTCNPMTGGCNTPDGGSSTPDAGVDAGVQCGGAICQAGRICVMNQCQVVMCSALQGCPMGYQCVQGYCQ